MKINCEKIERHLVPFRYLKANSFLDFQAANEILDWLETHDDLWHLTRADFYTQYEFGLNQNNVPKHLDFLIGESFLSNMKNLVEQYFECQLSEHIEVVAHKLIDGHMIQIHNDFLGDRKNLDFEPESHRLLIQLNRGWHEDKGGFLILFNSDDLQDIHDVIMPNHNDMFAFEISRNSYHAVSKIHNGTRFTLIFNFYPK